MAEDHHDNQGNLVSTKEISRNGNGWKWQSVVLPPQESVDNGLSLFDYGLDDPYNDLIDDFNSYLEYDKVYQNRMAFEDAFY